MFIASLGELLALSILGKEDVLLVAPDVHILCKNLLHQVNHFVVGYQRSGVPSSRRESVVSPECLVQVVPLILLKPWMPSWVLGSLHWLAGATFLGVLVILDHQAVPKTKVRSWILF
jgi:hypothetical protein